MSFAILSPFSAPRAFAAAKNKMKSRDPFELCSGNGWLTSTNSCSSRSTKKSATSSRYAINVGNLRVPFFFKQWGGVRKAKHGRLLEGRTYDEYPLWVASPIPDRASCVAMLNSFRKVFSAGSLVPDHGLGVPQKIRVPRWCWVHSSRPVARLDPCLTCDAASLAGRLMRSSLGLRAYRQPEKPTQRLGTLSCLRRFFLFSSTSALL